MQCIWRKQDQSSFCLKKQTWPLFTRVKSIWHYAPGAQCTMVLPVSCPRGWVQVYPDWELSSPHFPLQVHRDSEQPQTAQAVRCFCQRSDLLRTMIFNKIIITVLLLFTTKPRLHKPLWPTNGEVGGIRPKVMNELFVKCKDKIFNSDHVM